MKIDKSKLNDRTLAKVKKHKIRIGCYERKMIRDHIGVLMDSYDYKNGQEVIDYLIDIAKEYNICVAELRVEIEHETEWEKGSGGRLISTTLSSHCNISIDRLETDGEAAERVIKEHS